MECFLVSIYLIILSPEVILPQSEFHLLSASEPFGPAMLICLIILSPEVILPQLDFHLLSVSEPSGPAMLVRR